MKVVRHKHDSKVKDLTRDFPKGIPFSELVMIERKDMPHGIWQNLFAAVSGGQDRFVPSGGEIIVFINTEMDGHGMHIGFAHGFDICFMSETSEGFSLMPLVTVDPDDLTWDDECSADIIQNEIWVKTTEAFNHLTDKNIEIARRIEMVSALIGSLIAPRV